MHAILSKENQFLELNVYSNGVVKLRNKADQQLWEMGPVAIQEDNEIDHGHVWIRNLRSICEEYGARFEVREEKGSLVYRMLDGIGAFRGSFSCKITLEEKWVRFSVFDIDRQIPSLAFPTPFVNESLVLPIGEGQWIRKPSTDRMFYPTLGSSKTMRWIGGLNGEKGWIGVYEKGFEDSGMLTTQLAVTPVWLKSMGKWQGEREIKYTFVDSGGYVALAKVFRRYAMENNLFKSLKEKAKDCPSVKKILKGRDVYFYEASPMPQRKELEERYINGVGEEEIKAQVHLTHKEAAERIKHLETIHDAGLVQLGGWLNKGYDGRYPDVWPFEEALGSEEDFYDALHASDKFTIGIHDNYQDIYAVAPSFPKGVNVLKDGQLMRGGVWGGGQQAYILNSRNSVEYQKRNWEHISRVDPQFVYTDTVCDARPYESYESGNELTRAEDLQYKQELLKFYKDRGRALGTEGGLDFGMPYVDWLAANRTHTMGVTIPLWSLVYHDAVVNGNDRVGDLEAEYQQYGTFPSLLNLMLWGNQLHCFGIKKSNWEQYLRLAEKTKYLDEWFGEISTEEMVSHRYLTENGEVEQTVFESGKSIAVNFTERPIEVNGRTIPGFGYIIEKGL